MFVMDIRVGEDTTWYAHVAAERKDKGNILEQKHQNWGFWAKDPKETGIREVKEKSDKHRITLLVPSSMGSFSFVKPEKYDQNVSS